MIPSGASFRPRLLFVFESLVGAMLDIGGYGTIAAHEHPQRCVALYFVLST